MIDQLQERIAELETANRQLQAEANRYKQLEIQSQRQFQEATLLHRISTHIALAEDMVAALQGVCTELARFLKVPQAGFALLSPDRSTAAVVADYRPPDSPSAMGTRIPVAGNPSMVHVLDHGAPLAVSDAQKDPILMPVHDIMRQRNVASILIVPIIADRDVIGTLGFDTFERRVFSQSDIELVQHVANQAGQVLLRKQAEEALQASEEALRALLNATDDVLMLTDIDGIILEANETAARRFGLHQDEFLGSNIWDLMPPDLARQRMAYADEILRSGKPIRAEDWRAGIWFDTAIHPVPDSQGTITRFAVFARDITERKKMEELLRDSLEETARGQQMLLALSQATQEVQRAKTPEEIYRFIGEEIASMGLDVTVFALSTDQSCLIPVHMTYSPLDLQAAAEITGFTPQQHRFPVVPGGLVEQVIAARKAVFSREPDEYMAQVMSDSVATSLKQLTSSMGVKRVIHAPLVIGDAIHGLLVVTGSDLKEADTQAMNVFARHTAIALENAQLFQDARTWAAELEERVAERTEELASANVELETALVERRRVEGAVRHSRTETLRSHRLLLALSQAAEQVQRARSPEEVYQTIGDEVARLGYRVIFMSLTDEQTHLFMSYLTLQLTTPQAAEQLSAGLPMYGFQIPFVAGDPFHRIITQNESAFFEQTAERLTRGFGSLPRNSLEQMIAVLGSDKSIYAPLNVNNKLHGLLAVAGSDLTETDLPTVTLFANRAAIAMENAQLVEQLMTGRQQLQQLTRQVVSAQEDERQRLSRTLHDEAGQALTALKISLSLIEEDLPEDNASLRRRIKDATALTDTTMERIRLLAQGLRPPALDALGLNHTLASLCQDFSARIQLPIDYDGMELPWRSEPVNIVLYRFVQEALTNIAKHANAQRVSVALHHDAQALTLSVEDDGQGFDPHLRDATAGRPAGIGLLGMQERIESLGGQLEIVSHLGQGSRLVAHIPLEEGQVDLGTMHTHRPR